jgi:hypothetical protein
MEPEPGLFAFAERILKVVSRRDPERYMDPFDRHPGVLFVGSDPDEWREHDFRIRIEVGTDPSQPAGSAAAPTQLAKAGFHFCHVGDRHRQLEHVMVGLGRFELPISRPPAERSRPN